MNMDIQTNSFLSIDQLADRIYSGAKQSDKAQTTDGLSFRNILEQKTGSNTDGLKFSKHASYRLSDRGIELTDNQLERLNEGTGKAGKKGINDALVVVDDLAFIVNVPNRTVITAMDSSQTDENVFTNINGAVIM
jgi:flagellar operon protein